MAVLQLPLKMDLSLAPNMGMGFACSIELGEQSVTVTGNKVQGELWHAYYQAG